ncbi:IclR family transcriptional regulator [Pedobacter sp.]
MQQAINRSFDILEYIGTDPEVPRSFSEIAVAVGLNTGTCANIIKAMVKRGYLEKLDDKKGYLLGKSIYQLTRFNGYRKNLADYAAPVLEKITEKIKENTLIAVLKDDSRIVLYQSQSKQDIQAVLAIDKSAYDSSTGRLLVAMLPDRELEKFVTIYGLPSPSVWKEAATKKNFLKIVEQIRKDGYVLQESERHISGIAVGVSQDGRIIASIGVYMPSFRLNDTNRASLIEEMKNGAIQISSLL